MGKIIHAYKKEGKTEVTNYRPISLLSSISKIIKKWSMIGFMNKTMHFKIINLDSEIIIQQIKLS